MIQKLLAVVTALITLIFDGRKTVKDLKQEVADRDKTIADLLAAHAADDADDEALEAAAEAAKKAQEASEKSLADLNAEIDAAAAEADKKLAEVTADETIPIAVNPDTGAVIAQ